MDLNLNHLTESERDAILSVLRRDEDLRSKESDRVRKLRHEIKQIKLKGVIRPGDDPDNSCTRCREKFGWLMNRGVPCPKCQHKICQNCRRYLTSTSSGSWICVLCFKQKELDAMSGQWFYSKFRESKRNRKTKKVISGPDLVRTSIRRKGFSSNRSHDTPQNGTPADEVKNALSAKPNKSQLNAPLGNSIEEELSDTQSTEAVVTPPPGKQKDRDIMAPKDTDQERLHDLMQVKGIVNAADQPNNVHVRKIKSKKYQSDSDSSSSESRPSSPHLTESAFSYGESQRSSMRSSSAVSSDGHITMVTESYVSDRESMLSFNSETGSPHHRRSASMRSRTAHVSSDSVIENPSHSSQILEDSVDGTPKQESMSSGSEEEDYTTEQLTKVKFRRMSTNRRSKSPEGREPSPRPNEDKKEQKPPCVAAGASGGRDSPPSGRCTPSGQTGGETNSAPVHAVLTPASHTTSSSTHSPTNLDAAHTEGGADRGDQDILRERVNALLARYGRNEVLGGVSDEVDSVPASGVGARLTHQSDPQGGSSSSSVNLNDSASDLEWEEDMQEDMKQEKDSALLNELRQAVAVNMAIIQSDTQALNAMDPTGPVLHRGPGVAEEDIPGYNDELDLDDYSNPLRYPSLFPVQETSPDTLSVITEHTEPDEDNLRFDSSDRFSPDATSDNTSSTPVTTPRVISLIVDENGATPKAISPVDATQDSFEFDLNDENLKERLELQARYYDLKMLPSSTQESRVREWTQNNMPPLLRRDTITQMAEDSIEDSELDFSDVLQENFKYLDDDDARELAHDIPELKIQPSKPVTSDKDHTYLQTLKNYSIQKQKDLEDRQRYEDEQKKKYSPENVYSREKLKRIDPNKSQSVSEQPQTAEMLFSKGILRENPGRRNMKERHEESQNLLSVPHVDDKAVDYSPCASVSDLQKMFDKPLPFQSGSFRTISSRNSSGSDDEEPNSAGVIIEAREIDVDTMAVKATLVEGSVVEHEKAAFTENSRSAKKEKSIQRDSSITEMEIVDDMGNNIGNVTTDAEEVTKQEEKLEELRSTITFALRKLSEHSIDDAFAQSEDVAEGQVEDWEREDAFGNYAMEEPKPTREEVVGIMRELLVKGSPRTRGDGLSSRSLSEEELQARLAEENRQQDDGETGGGWVDLKHAGGSLGTTSSDSISGGNRSMFSTEKSVFRGESNWEKHISTEESGTLDVSVNSLSSLVASTLDTIHVPFRHMYKQAYNNVSHIEYNTVLNKSSFNDATPVTTLEERVFSQDTRKTDKRPESVVVDSGVSNLKISKFGNQKCAEKSVTNPELNDVEPANTSAYGINEKAENNVGPSTFQKQTKKELDYFHSISRKPQVIVEHSESPSYTYHGFDYGVLHSGMYTKWYVPKSWAMCHSSTIQSVNDERENGFVHHSNLVGRNDGDLATERIEKSVIISDKAILTMTGEKYNLHSPITINHNETEPARMVSDGLFHSQCSVSTERYESVVIEERKTLDSQLQRACLEQSSNLIENGVKAHTDSVQEETVKSVRNHSKEMSQNSFFLTIFSDTNNDTALEHHDVDLGACNFSKVNAYAELASILSRSSKEADVCICEDSDEETNTSCHSELDATYICRELSTMGEAIASADLTQQRTEPDGEESSINSESDEDQCSSYENRNETEVSNNLQKVYCDSEADIKHNQNSVCLEQNYESDELHQNDISTVHTEAEGIAINHSQSYAKMNISRLCLHTRDNSPVSEIDEAMGFTQEGDIDNEFVPTWVNRSKNTKMTDIARFMKDDKDSDESLSYVSDSDDFENAHIGIKELERVKLENLVAVLRNTSLKECPKQIGSDKSDSDSITVSDEIYKQICIDHNEVIQHAMAYVMLDTDQSSYSSDTEIIPVTTDRDCENRMKAITQIMMHGANGDDNLYASYESSLDEDDHSVVEESSLRHAVLEYSSKSKAVKLEHLANILMENYSRHPTNDQELSNIDKYDSENDSISSDDQLEAVNVDRCIPDWHLQTLLTFSKPNVNELYDLQTTQQDLKPKFDNSQLSYNTNEIDEHHEHPGLDSEILPTTSNRSCRKRMKAITKIMMRGANDDNYLGASDESSPDEDETSVGDKRSLHHADLEYSGKSKAVKLEYLANILMETYYHHPSNDQELSNIGRYDSENDSLSSDDQLDAVSVDRCIPDWRLETLLTFSKPNVNELYDLQITQQDLKPKFDNSQFSQNTNEINEDHEHSVLDSEILPTTSDRSCRKRMKAITKIMMRGANDDDFLGASDESSLDEDETSVGDESSVHHADLEYSGKSKTVKLEYLANILMQTYPNHLGSDQELSNMDSCDSENDSMSCDSENDSIPSDDQLEAVSIDRCIPDWNLETLLSCSKPNQLHELQTTWKGLKSKFDNSQFSQNTHEINKDHENSCLDYEIIPTSSDRSGRKRMKAIAKIMMHGTNGNDNLGISDFSSDEDEPCVVDESSLHHADLEYSGKSKAVKLEYLASILMNNNSHHPSNDHEISEMDKYDCDSDSISEDRLELVSVDRNSQYLPLDMLMTRKLCEDSVDQRETKYRVEKRFKHANSSKVEMTSKDILPRSRDDQKSKRIGWILKKGELPVHEPVTTVDERLSTVSPPDQTSTDTMLPEGKTSNAHMVSKINRKWRSDQFHEQETGNTFVESADTMNSDIKTIDSYRSWALGYQTDQRSALDGSGIGEFTSGSELTTSLSHRKMHRSWALGQFQTPCPGKTCDDTDMHNDPIISNSHITNMTSKPTVAPQRDVDTGPDYIPYSKELETYMRLTEHDSAKKMIYKRDNIHQLDGDMAVRNSILSKASNTNKSTPKKRVRFIDDCVQVHDDPLTHKTMHHRHKTDATQRSDASIDSQCKSSSLDAFNKVIKFSSRNSWGLGTSGMDTLGSSSSADKQTQGPIKVHRSWALMGDLVTRSGTADDRKCITADGSNVRAPSATKPGESYLSNLNTTDIADPKVDIFSQQISNLGNTTLQLDNVDNNIHFTDDAIQPYNTVKKTINPQHERKCIYDNESNVKSIGKLHNIRQTRHAKCGRTDDGSPQHNQDIPALETSTSRNSAANNTYTYKSWALSDMCVREKETRLASSQIYDHSMARLHVRKSHRSWALMQAEAHQSQVNLNLSNKDIETKTNRLLSGDMRTYQPSPDTNTKIATEVPSHEVSISSQKTNHIVSSASGKAEERLDSGVYFGSNNENKSFSSHSGFSHRSWALMNMEPVKSVSGPKQSKVFSSSSAVNVHKSWALLKDIQSNEELGSDSTTKVSTEIPDCDTSTDTNKHGLTLKSNVHSSYKDSGSYGRDTTHGGNVYSYAQHKVRRSSETEPLRENTSQTHSLNICENLGEKQTTLVPSTQNVTTRLQGFDNIAINPQDTKRRFTVLKRGESQRFRDKRRRHSLEVITTAVLSDNTDSTEPQRRHSHGGESYETKGPFESTKDRRYGIKVENIISVCRPSSQSQYNVSNPQANENLIQERPLQNENIVQVQSVANMQYLIAPIAEVEDFFIDDVEEELFVPVVREKTEIVSSFPWNDKLSDHEPMELGKTGNDVIEVVAELNSSLLCATRTELVDHSPLDDCREDNCVSVEHSDSFTNQEKPSAHIQDIKSYLDDKHGAMPLRQESVFHLDGSITTSVSLYCTNTETVSMGMPNRQSCPNETHPQIIGTNDWSCENTNNNSSGVLECDSSSDVYSSAKQRPNEINRNESVSVDSPNDYLDKDLSKESCRTNAKFDGVSYNKNCRKLKNPGHFVGRYNRCVTKTVSSHGYTPRYVKNTKSRNSRKIYDKSREANLSDDIEGYSEQIDQEYIKKFAYNPSEYGEDDVFQYIDDETGACHDESAHMDYDKMSQLKLKSSDIRTKESSVMYPTADFNMRYSTSRIPLHYVQTDSQKDLDHTGRGVSFDSNLATQPEDVPKFRLIPCDKDQDPSCSFTQPSHAHKYDDEDELCLSPEVSPTDPPFGALYADARGGFHVLRYRSTLLHPHHNSSDDDTPGLIVVHPATPAQTDSPEEPRSPPMTDNTYAEYFFSLPSNVLAARQSHMSIDEILSEGLETILEEEEDNVDAGGLLGTEGVYGLNGQQSHIKNDTDDDYDLAAYCKRRWAENRSLSDPSGMSYARRNHFYSYAQSKYQGHNTLQRSLSLDSNHDKSYLSQHPNVFQYTDTKAWDEDFTYHIEECTPFDNLPSDEFPHHDAPISTVQTNLNKDECVSHKTSVTSSMCSAPSEFVECVSVLGECSVDSNKVIQFAVTLGGATNSCETSCLDPTLPTPSSSEPTPLEGSLKANGFLAADRPPSPQGKTLAEIASLKSDAGSNAGTELGGERAASPLSQQSHEGKSGQPSTQSSLPSVSVTPAADRLNAFCQSPSWKPRLLQQCQIQDALVPNGSARPSDNGCVLRGKDPINTEHRKVTFCEIPHDEAIVSVNRPASIITTIDEESDEVFLSQNGDAKAINMAVDQGPPMSMGMGAVGQTLVWMTQQMEVMAIWRQIVSPPHPASSDSVQRETNPQNQRRSLQGSDKGSMAEGDNMDDIFASQTSTLSAVSTRSNLLSTSFSGSRESINSYYSDAGEGHFGNIAVTGDIMFSVDYNYKMDNLEVRIKECKDLAIVDTKKKRTDPYVKTYLLPDKTKNGKRKTKVKKNTVNPVFDELIRYRMTKSELETRTLWVTVWHSDHFGRNDFLGEVTIPLDYYPFDDPSPQWYKLQERLITGSRAGAKKKKSGTMSSSLSLLTYKGDLILSLKYVPADVSGSKSKKGEIHVLVKEARNLTAVRSNGTSDPFCKAYLLPDKTSRVKQKTPVVKKNCNPQWNHTFIFENIASEELNNRSLELTIWDHDRLSSNQFLGGIRLNLGVGTQGGREVDWMDARGEEITLWQCMMDRPNVWVDGSLMLRPTMDKQHK